MNLAMRPDMTLAVAESLLDEVKKQAAMHGCTLAAVVVDRAGNTVACCRMDDAQMGATSIASDKAFTAAAFGLPTATWAGSSVPAGADWGLAGSLGGRCIVFPGGVPIYSGRNLIGAVGVSGAASITDETCAEAAVVHAGFRVARS